jgi:hypothetical protein
MRYLAAVLLLYSSFAFCAKHPCVIVKRHVHKFGENATRFHPHRPFDYVEGTYPSGFKWRSELSDGQVRELQKKGGRIVVLSPDYQLSDLEDARKQCAVPSPPHSPAPSSAPSNPH